MDKKLIDLKHKNQKEILEIKQMHFIEQKNISSGMMERLWKLKNELNDKNHKQKLERLEFAYKLKKK